MQWREVFVDELSGGRGVLEVPDLWPLDAARRLLQSGENCDRHDEEKRDEPREEDNNARLGVGANGGHLERIDDRDEAVHTQHEHDEYARALTEVGERYVDLAVEGAEYPLFVEHGREQHRYERQVGEVADGQVEQEEVGDR